MRQHGCVFSAPVFVSIFILGINRKSKKTCEVPQCSFNHKTNAMWYWPVPHGPRIPVPNWRYK